MYTTGFSVASVTKQLIKQANWERQVREMATNYELLSLLLGQSTSISQEYRQKCIRLRQELTRTLEEFMSELENDDTNSEILKLAIFTKHVDTMKRLNQSVGVLISLQTFS